MVKSRFAASREGERPAKPAARCFRSLPAAGGEEGDDHEGQRQTQQQGDQAVANLGQSLRCLTKHDALLSLFRLFSNTQGSKPRSFTCRKECAKGVACFDQSTTSLSMTGS